MRTKGLNILLATGLAATLILFSCENQPGDSKEEEKVTAEQITRLEDELFSDTSKQINSRPMLELVKLYERFADANPDDPRSPEYLFKAADLSMNLRRSRKTLELFDKLIERYPYDVNTPTAWFLKGFVLEDQLKDYEEARKVYEEFLEKYPDSDFADDAEMSLRNLGKTPEELIREFEQLEDQGI